MYLDGVPCEFVVKHLSVFMYLYTTFLFIVFLFAPFLFYLCVFTSYSLFVCVWVKTWISAGNWSQIPPISIHVCPINFSPGICVLKVKIGKVKKEQMAPAHAFNYRLLWLKHKQIKAFTLFHSWLALLILLLNNANQTLACGVLTPTGLPTSLQEMSMDQMWTHICDIFNVLVCCCMKTAQKLAAAIRHHVADD